MLFTFFLVILLILAIRYKRDTVIFCLLVAAAMAIMGLNYYNPDYSNYTAAYNYARYPSRLNLLEILDVGYKISMAFAKSIRIYQYADFRLIISVISLSIFAIFLYRNCKYYNLFLAIYIVFYLALDQIQIRNFIAFSIVLPFFFYYIKNQNLKGLLFFIAGVAVAFTFHFSSVFYLIFCATIIKNKYIKAIIIIASMFILAGMQFGVTKIAMFNHVEAYEKPSAMGALFGCFALVSSALYIWWINHRFVEKKLDLSNPKNLTFARIFNILMQINFILICICPIIFMNATVLRIWRFISIINLIGLVNFLYYCKNKQANRAVSVSMLCYVALITVYFNEPGVFPSLFLNPIFE